MRSARRLPHVESASRPARIVLLSVIDNRNRGHLGVTTVPFLSDLTRLRIRARKHSAEGVAPAGNAARRATIVQLLNDVLASELIWLMRYRRSSLLRLGKTSIGDAHADDEPTPADRLAQRIVELGGRPDLDPIGLLTRGRAHYAPHGPTSDRVREDLQAERLLIDSYTDVIHYLGTSDPPTQAMLQANLGRERARAEELSRILRDLEAQSLDRAS
jgi:bacterioferritin